MKIHQKKSALEMVCGAGADAGKGTKFRREVTCIACIIEDLRNNPHRAKKAHNARAMMGKKFPGRTQERFEFFIVNAERIKTMSTKELLAELQEKKLYARESSYRDVNFEYLLQAIM